MIVKYVSSLYSRVWADVFYMRYPNAGKSIRPTMPVIMAKKDLNTNMQPN